MNLVDLLEGRITNAEVVLKPWGWEKIWACSDNYVGKILPNTIHRFEAPANGEPVVLLEASTPELDDIIRLEDDYNRLDAAK